MSPLRRIAILVLAAGLFLVFAVHTFSQEANNDITRYGRIRKPWIGAHTQSITEEVSRALGLKSTAGVLLVEVDRGSSAGEAGIRHGDVIKRAESGLIRDEVDWESFLLSMYVGERVELEIISEGKIVHTAFAVIELRRKEK